VIYSPEVDRVFWILQYSNDANGENIIRVAWASPNRIATDAVHAWNWIDLDSTSLVGTGKCFDQPHVGLAPGYLMMQINQCVGGKVQQSVFFRLHLSDVDKPQMNFEYAAGGVVSARPARSNSGDIRYFVGQKNTSTLRVYHWKQNEGYVYYDDIGIPTIATSNWTSNTPGGVDWLTRQQNSQGTAVTGVTVAHGKVWATWSAARSSIDNNGNAHQVHTQPAIEGALISLNADGSAASATPLTYYNDSVAVAMPDLATNANGEVGLAFEQGGGGTAYPAHGVGILTGTPKFAFDITGNTDNDTVKCGAGCTGDPAGDYSTVGIEYPASQCFTSSGVAHATAKTAPSPRSLPRLSIFARRGTQDCTPSGTFGPSPASSQMTIGCPAQVTAGDSFNVSGSLTPARSGAPIKVVFTHPDASLDEHDISTDAGSHYATDESTTTDQIGTWRIVASWPGDSNTSPSSAGCAVRVVAPPPPNLLPSTITIYCPSSSDPANPDVFQSGETVTTTGGVYTQSTKAANTPVIVDYVPESANDTEFKDTVMTNSNGDYSDSVMLPSGFPHGGYWDIYAYWNGNSQYEGATSGTCRIYQHQAIG
jgi:hypothetical protein